MMQPGGGPCLISPAPLVPSPPWGEKPTEKGGGTKLSTICQISTTLLLVPKVYSF